jgi:radical SAM protein (TIGR01212 family)
MNNPYENSFDNKRYQTLNYYLRNKYNSKVCKVPLDAGFTCPNRDGKCGTGGCLFCSDQGSGEFTLPNETNLLSQYYENKKMMLKKWPNSLLIPYYQSYTNTYGTLDRIKECMNPFLDLEEVVAISIATRPDCLEDKKIEYFESLTHKKDIWLELGLQTTNDKTSILMNRGHDFDCLKDCLNRLKDTNIKICIHIINSLPFEKESDMLKTIKDLKGLHFHSIKIHMLHISSNSNIKNMYTNDKFELLKKDEYVEIVVKQLELLNKDIIVERLTGDPVKELLIAPKWVLNKTDVLNSIDKLFHKKNTYQGIYYDTY